MDQSSTTQTDVSNGGGEIIIRRYRDHDKEQVHEIFRRGMESLVPNLTKNVISDPLFFLPMGSLAWMIKWGVSKATTTMLLAPSGSSRRGSGTPLSAWVASAGFAAASILAVHGIGYRMFGGYIQKSIATDLSDIHGTYFVNGGTLLVAQDVKSGDIVGCIAGQHKVDEEPAKKKTFELRRMSVDSRVQRRGIGKRLVESLEQELIKSGCSHIHLGTSSLQVSP